MDATPSTGAEDKSETRVLFVTVVNKPEKMTMWFCVFGLDNIIYMYTYRVAAMLNADGVGWGGEFRCSASGLKSVILAQSIFAGL